MKEESVTLTICYKMLPVFILLIGLANGSNPHLVRLMNDLHENYSHFVRPVHNSNSAIVVETSFDLRTVQELDERNQKLVTSGWFTFSWVDAFLQWDPSKYSNITEFSADDTWKPDIVMFNGYSSFMDFRTTPFKSVVYSTGLVMWAPAMTFDTHCDVDVTFYPFDKQLCSLELIIWTESEEDVKLVNSKEKINLGTYVPNGEWYLGETSVHSNPMVNPDCCHGSFSRLTFNLTLSRRRQYFIISILIPAVSESLLCNVVFLVPSESGEKMSLAITVLLSYAVFLASTVDSLPHSSLNISIISIYMMSVLVLGTVSVFLTGVSLCIYHRPPNKSFKLPLPDHETLLVKNGEEMTMNVGCALCRPTEKEIAMDVGCALCRRPITPTDTKEIDGKELSRRFDRICLAIVSTITLVSIPCFVVTLTWLAP